MSSSDPLGPGVFPPPPGVVPNFKHPRSWEIQMNIQFSIIIAVITVTTTIRLVTKLYIKRKHEVEDYFMYAGWAFTMAYIVLMFLLTYQAGGGDNVWNLTAEEHVIFMKYGVALEALYKPAWMAIKVALFLQISKLFSILKDKRYWIIMISLVINILFYTATFIASLLQCIPLARAWDLSVPGSCFDAGILLTTVGAFNLVSDVGILLLPIIWIWSLQLTRRKKFGASATFAVAFFGILCSVVRLFYSIRNLRNPDISASLFRVLLASAGELAAGILAGNMVLFPLFCSRAWAKIRPASLKPSSAKSDSYLLSDKPRSRSRKKWPSEWSDIEHEPSFNRIDWNPGPRRPPRRDSDDVYFASPIQRPLQAV